MAQNRIVSYLTVTGLILITVIYLQAGPVFFFRSSSKDNYLKHVIIKNAYQGLIAQDLSLDANPKLRISQCVIDNIYDAGILGLNTNIYADNCLITNCGSNVELGLGGDYHFIHCTVTSYNNFFISHKTPVLQVSNAAMQGSTVLTAELNALFQNCIFWGDGGNVDDEIVVDIEPGSNSHTVNFDHVLYKAKSDVPNGVFDAFSIKNTDPVFDSIDVSHQYYDFHLQAGSPAIDAGVITAFPTDLDDKPRGLKPDLGCFER